MSTAGDYGQCTRPFVAVALAAVLFFGVGACGRGDAPAAGRTPAAAAPVPTAAPAASTVTSTAAAAAAAAGRIAYLRSERLGELYILDPATPDQPRALTRDQAEDDAPVFSPDGSQVAFVGTRDGNRELYLVNADGTGRRRLTHTPGDESTPAFSPDGRQIAFVSEPAVSAEIYVIDTDGSDLTRLTRNRHIDHRPVFSPDGHRIAFLSKRDLDTNGAGNYEVYVMDADGTDQTRLTEHQADSHDQAWSPDGTQIAFVSWRSGRDALYVMGADGAGQRRLGTVAGQVAAPVYSPDGSTIVVGAGEGAQFDLYAVATADGTTTRLTDAPGVDADPAISPDGSRVVFRSERDGNSELYVMAADGSGQRRVTATPAVESQPSWAAAVGRPGPVDTAADAVWFTTFVVDEQSHFVPERDGYLVLTRAGGLLARIGHADGRVGVHEGSVAPDLVASAFRALASATAPQDSPAPSAAGEYVALHRRIGGSSVDLPPVALERAGAELREAVHTLRSRAAETPSTDNVLAFLAATPDLGVDIGPVSGNRHALPSLAELAEVPSLRAATTVPWRYIPVRDAAELARLQRYVRIEGSRGGERYLVTMPTGRFDLGLLTGTR